MASVEVGEIQNDLGGSRNAKVTLQTVQVRPESQLGSL